MFGFLFGDRIKKALNEGAVIVDVRPAYAFDQHGRIPGSINIPLDRIIINIGRLKSIKKPIIICCAYGNDCVQAARILKENGIAEVYNGGNWESLIRKVR
jgi:rhodanese-related sulfurtransferase